MKTTPPSTCATCRSSLRSGSVHNGAPMSSLRFILEAARVFSPLSRTLAITRCYGSLGTAPASLSVHAAFRSHLSSHVRCAPGVPHAWQVHPARSLHTVAYDWKANREQKERARARVPPSINGQPQTTTQRLNGQGYGQRQVPNTQHENGHEAAHQPAGNGAAIHHTNGSGAGQQHQVDGNGASGHQQTSTAAPPASPAGNQISSYAPHQPAHTNGTVQASTHGALQHQPVDVQQYSTKANGHSQDTPQAASDTVSAREGSPQPQQQVPDAAASPAPQRVRGNSPKAKLPITGASWSKPTAVRPTAAAAPAPPAAASDEVVKPAMQQVQAPGHVHEDAAAQHVLEQAPTAPAAADTQQAPRVLLSEPPPDVCIVDNGAAAERVVAELMRLASVDPPPLVSSKYQSSNDKLEGRFFACDTEVAFIDVKEESPVGHGTVTCFSIYCGPDADFGPAVRGKVEDAAGRVPGDPGYVAQSRVWVDVWAEVETQRVLDPETGAQKTGELEVEPVWELGKVKLKEQHPIFSAFKRFFESEETKKVWHNYGFDRHVMANMGIYCQGFAADTMHMARLNDASRRGRKTYGLDSLSSDADIMNILLGSKGRGARDTRAAAAAPVAPADSLISGLLREKVSMKVLFGERKLKADGTEGKVVELPAVHKLQEDPVKRASWIDYSALDAQATWVLREALKKHLIEKTWEMDPYLAKLMGVASNRTPLQPFGSGPVYRKNMKDARKRAAPMIDPNRDNTRTLYDCYKKNWVPFGLILTDMEAEGMLVNRAHLAAAQVQAEADQEKATKTFMAWAEKMVPDAKYMNPSSQAQIRQLLFPENPGVITRPKLEEAPVNSGSPARSTSPEPALADLPAPVARADQEEGEEEGEEEAGGKKKKKKKKKKKVVKAKAKAKVKVEPEPLPPGCRVFKVPNPDYEQDLVAGLKPKKYKNITLHGIWGKGVKGALAVEAFTETKAAVVSMRVLKVLAGKGGAARKALAELDAVEAAAKSAEEATNAATATAATAEAAPPILEDDDEEALRSLFQGEDAESGDRPEGESEVEVPAGLTDAQQAARDKAHAEKVAALEAEAKAKGFGKLYAALGGGRAGLEACVAVEALCEVSAIDKLLSAFIKPLQQDKISTTVYGPGGEVLGHRVHCSLNINTETGRLSARRPNLQNQPALEKDRYKVRKAFTADVAQEKTLIVADYGQLELRILAHMADCKSMIEAFELGGDFHSRTAYGMYDHIKQDIKEGGCIIEWEGEGVPDKPLLKDKYASERRKAKILNFSIAYGKTAHGLAKDFGTTLQEAEDTVAKWYADRKEVKQWQENTRFEARRCEGTPYVSTILGRRRPLADLRSEDRGKRGHAERAAINTPIQGSAADVASSAMVAIARCPELKRLGYTLIMQVHDEVILEGPKQHAEEARQLVVAHMANPWLADMAVKPDRNRPLRVELATDCNTADTWYEAK